VAVERIETTLKCTVTFDANLPANSVKIVNMTLDPLVGAQTVLQVPDNEAWVIEDIYVTSSPDVDAIVDIYKNELDVVLKTDPISTLLVSNPSRPKYGKKVFEPGARLSMRAVNLAAIGTEAVTDTFYVKLVRFVKK